MELASFHKKFRKNKSNPEKIYFMIFDRYLFFESRMTYSECREKVKQLLDTKNVNPMDPKDIRIQENSCYLTHMDSKYKFKQMGYNQIAILN